MLSSDALGFVIYGRERALNYTNPLPKALMKSMGSYDRIVPVDFARAITRVWPGAVGAVDRQKPSDCMPNEAVSPVHGDCVCAPGFKYNADYSACIPGATRNFPDCKDATGKKLPGCFMGYSVSQYAPFVVGGAFAGVLLAAIAMSVVR